MDRLKQTDYLKVQLNNNQHIGLDQIRQTQSVSRKFWYIKFIWQYF